MEAQQCVELTVTNSPFGLTIKFTVSTSASNSGLSVARQSFNFIQLLGDHSVGVPPVPIPNTEVKPHSPDGTARASVWESRTSPE